MGEPQALDAKVLRSVAVNPLAFLTRQAAALALAAKMPMGCASARMFVRPGNPFGSLFFTRVRDATTTHPVCANLRVNELLGAVMKSSVVAAVMFVALLATAIVIIELVRVPNMYAVDGVGSIIYQPDSAELSIGVRSESEQAADAARKTAQTMRTVLAAVRVTGTIDADIRTTSVRVEKVEYDRNAPNPPLKAMFFAEQSVSVKVYDFSRISKILDAALRSGATESVVRYSLTDGKKKEFAVRARKEALADAMARADAYAKDGQFVRGRVLKIQDGTTNFPDVDYSGRQFSLSGKWTNDPVERKRDYTTTPTVTPLDSPFDIPNPEDATMSASVGVLFEIK